MRTQSRRRGVTLLEVLTAIFIMGVGLLALLTLFPLGAISMGRAVRDDRAAAIGANASALAVAMDLRNDPFLSGPLSAAPAGFALAPDGPGYPVMVDPRHLLVLGSSRIGDRAGVTPGVQRVAPSYAATNATQFARWFTFQDEITFEPNGSPSGAPVTVRRPGTYSWAYMVRRPRASTPAMTELSVIVYANRATDSVQGETTVPVTAGGAAGTNTATVTFTGDKPNVRKGSWVLDTTFRQIGGVPNTGTVSGHFYQVARVEDAGATGLDLTFETPLKEGTNTLVLLENVITVLDRGAAWRP